MATEQDSQTHSLWVAPATLYCYSSFFNFHKGVFGYFLMGFCLQPNLGATPKFFPVINPNILSWLRSIFGPYRCLLPWSWALLVPITWRGHECWQQLELGMCNLSSKAHTVVFWQLWFQGTNLFWRLWFQGTNLVISSDMFPVLINFWCSSGCGLRSCCRSKRCGRGAGPTTLRFRQSSWISSLSKEVLICSSLFFEFNVPRTWVKNMGSLSQMFLSNFKIQGCGSRVTIQSRKSATTMGPAC